MQIRIVGTRLPGRECERSDDFPGYSNIYAGVQRKNRPDELLDLHPGDAAQAVWTLDCSVDGTDVRFLVMELASGSLEPADLAGCDVLHVSGYSLVQDPIRATAL